MLYFYFIENDDYATLGDIRTQKQFNILTTKVFLVTVIAANVETGFYPKVYRIICLSKHFILFNKLLPK
jgi:cysteine sulfinate desulfinase/cysteine desulfurase-like protein